jgi:hypothetical protein
MVKQSEILKKDPRVRLCPLSKQRRLKQRPRTELNLSIARTPFRAELYYWNPSDPLTGPLGSRSSTDAPDIGQGSAPIDTWEAEDNIH